MTHFSPTGSEKDTTYQKDRIIPSHYWDVNQYLDNSRINLKQIEDTIDDIVLDYTKVVICGKATNLHPDFFPRFSTPSTNIQSELYVLVDHKKNSEENITRGGSYALSIIVHPDVAKKIRNLGGKIFWFSPDYLENDLPKISHGKYPIGNSGLTAVAIAAYKNIRNILLSGINLTNEYSVFMEGKDIIFLYVRNKETKIYSTDGILAEKISFEDWLKI